VPPGSCPAPIAIYAATPVKAIVGVAELWKVEAMPPAKLWRKYDYGREIDPDMPRQMFDDYYMRRRTAYALHLRDPRKLTEPVTLDYIREMYPRFHPPQTWRGLIDLPLLVEKINFLGGRLTDYRQLALF
jgi:predicted transcriptional regulator